MTLPQFGLPMLVAMTDGLVARHVRRARGGHESATHFHRARRLLLFGLSSLVATVWIVVLAPLPIEGLFWPVSLVNLGRAVVLPDSAAASRSSSRAEPTTAKVIVPVPRPAPRIKTPGIVARRDDLLSNLPGRRRSHVPLSGHRPSPSLALREPHKGA